MRVSDIVDVVAADVGCTREELLGRGREERLMQARRLVYFFAHYDLGYSYNRIAIIFHRRHYNVVQDAIKLLVRTMIVDNATALRIVSLREQLTAQDASLFS